MLKEEQEEVKKVEREKIKDLFCMGLNKKSARGPNPLSMMSKSKAIKKSEKGVKKVKIKKRRLRKGKRSRELSQLKKTIKDNSGEMLMIGLKS